MLNATSFDPNALQFFNLLTGVTTDQPVTLGNSLSVGGDQRAGTAALRCYGGLELYTSRQDATPGFAIGPDGFAWSGAQFAPAGGGLRVGPRLEVDGDLAVSGSISGALPFDAYIASYLRTLRPGMFAMPGGLALGGGDPWAAELPSAQAMLVVRGADLPPRGVVSTASLQCWSGNWLQFNVRFWDTDPSQGWQSKQLTLDFDVDTQTAGTAGRITLAGGRVGIGDIPDIAGAIHGLEQRLSRRGL